MSWFQYEIDLRYEEVKPPESTVDVLIFYLQKLVSITSHTLIKPSRVNVPII